MSSYVAGVGVLEREGSGDGVERDDVGTRERLPDVVKGVRSSTSGNKTRTLFLEV